MASKKRPARPARPRPAHRPRSKPTNRFAAWVDSSKLPIRTLAKELGISQTYLYNLRVGRYAPSLDVAARIEVASKGEVPATSWTKE